MLSRQKEFRGRIQMALDTALFALAYYLAYLLRVSLPAELFGPGKDIASFDSYIWLYFLILPCTPLALNLQGFYSRPLLSARRLVWWQLFKACAWLAIGLIIYLWLVREKGYVARSVIPFFAGIGFLLVALKEEIIRRWYVRQADSPQYGKRLILVGTPEETVRLQKDIARSQKDGYSVVALLNLNEAPVQELVEMLHEHSANTVVLAAKHTYFGQIEQAIEVCEREGVEVWLRADFFKTQVSQTTVDDLYGLPMLVFRSVPEVAWPGLLKGAIDLFGAAFLLGLLCVPMLLVAAAIKLTSRGPVLFRQERSGLNGRPFTMLKFRSMATDAEQRKHELEKLNEMSGPVFKVTNDPRVTPLGRFLRKWSLDELPQLLNVFRGEMSLVGPRPLPVTEVKRFDDPCHRRRLSVKPGLTCLWQVSGRNNVTDFKEWVRLDLEYIDNWSLWLDIKILLKTIPAVFSGTGAK